MLVGVVVLAVALMSWGDVVYVVTRGAGGSQSPSALAIWWLDWMGWVVVALGVLTIATGATRRRDALMLIALPISDRVDARDPSRASSL